MQRRYNNLFFRIYYSFFSRNFYRYVALKQKRNGIRFLFYIIVLIWLIPSCLIYLKINNLTFEQTDNPIIKKLDFIISQIPDLEFKNNELVLREDQQQHFEIKDGIYDKNLLVIDLDASSLITSNAVIILSKEGIYFNELEFMLRVVNYLGIKSERLNIDI
ncbi:MAG: DUF1189 family protein [Flavobacteriaceae bacterium]|nr:DUF1189 family protein [Flavobacteriaceae bacterium]